MSTHRVWVRRPGLTPTCIVVPGTALVDDLKLAVLAKYPTLLAQHTDPADLTLTARLVTPRRSGKLFRFPDKREPTPTVLAADTAIGALMELHYPHGMEMADAWELGGNTTDAAAEQPLPRTTVTTPSPVASRRVSTADPYHLRLSLLLEIARPESPSQGRERPEAGPPVLLLPRNFTLPAKTPRALGSRPLLLQTLTESIEHMDQSSVESVETTKKEDHKSRLRITPVMRKQNRLLKSLVLLGGKGFTTEKVLPRIRVLIVEDNKVNIRILLMFMRQRNISYATALNGQEAVDCWREGGFHLVLMDIQLPVISGIDATREIRRLELINKIGVFAELNEMQSTTTSQLPFNEKDLLPRELFRLPVIIVALTASTLTQDRTEALAAGCNDFLTKPVKHEWLQNKITEWGCMQALIDFDLWKFGE